ncbi:hypothetical protein FGU71_11685 [Erythrobacter insulae]|uniref:Uncharacterized protein n=1 Tax=Erythrobacter insulae TaxID=2584124 RepID=A0A547PEB1_9SPHN|nr:hypothetical protein [Erythrobacter insulae]TRD12459.1 hypothetical protein FGU71_11685 [Erythrobacter insulae]
MSEMIGLLGSLALAAAVNAQPSKDVRPLPVTIPGAAVIEFGEWPLEKADPFAVEALFRHEIERMKARFGDELKFACLGYSYGQPTEAFFERVADTGIPLKGRLACSPYRSRGTMSVLIGLSTIRCAERVCTANTDISFGDTIERGIAISAYKERDQWSVRLLEDKR